MTSFIKYSLISTQVLLTCLLAQAVGAQEPGFTPGEPPFGAEPDAPPDVDPGTPPGAEIPELPSEEAAVAFFGDDLYIFPGNAANTDQWYFSYTFKSIFHFSGDNWFFFEEFNAVVYVDPSSGSLAHGFWAYMIRPDHASWVFLGRDANFYDLRDANADGSNDLADSQAGSQTLSGYLFFEDPLQGDPPGPAWYYFEEFDDGNWMINMNIPAPTSDDWHKLRD